MRSLLLPVYHRRVSLGGRHDEHVLHIYMRRAGDGKPYCFGDIDGIEWHKSIVYLSGTRFITFETNNRKFRFDGAGVDGGDAYPVLQEVNPHTFGQRLNGVLGGTIDIAVGINFLTGNGSDVNDVAASA